MLIQRFGEDVVTGSNLIFCSSKELDTLLSNYFDAIISIAETSGQKGLPEPYELIGRTVLCRAISWYSEQPVENRVVDIEVFARRIVDGLRFGKVNDGTCMFQGRDDEPLIGLIRSKAFG